jgi:hypothetical protein
MLAFSRYGIFRAAQYAKFNRSFHEQRWYITAHGWLMSKGGGLKSIMLRHTKRFTLAAHFTALFSVLMIPTLSAQAPAQNHAMIEWSADLSGARDSSWGAQRPTVQTPAAGKLTASFDFDHKIVTFQGQAKNIAGVSRIELRTTRSKGDLSGPVLVTLFDFHDGPFTGTFAKTVSSESFMRVATAITNGEAAVVVATDAHPDGEIAGFIEMHKHYQH